MDIRKENLMLAAGEVEDAIKGKPGMELDSELLGAIHKLSNALTEARRGRDVIEEAYFNQAKRELQKDGEVEIDDDAVVSVSDDDGAYVQAWVWVEDD